MGKYESQILVLLKDKDRTDRELANIILGKEKHQSPINQACNNLSKKKLIERTGSPILNRLIQNNDLCENEIIAKPLTLGLQEDKIKDILKQDLLSKKWNIDFFAPGNKPGTDIIARKEDQRWFIEVKGCGSRNSMRVNYFLSILGEILQRMDDPVAKYSIALPDMEQYRKLWNKLPALAKERTKIGIIFVKDELTIEYIG